MSHIALRQSLLRLRTPSRVILRAQVADTLREPTEATIDDELRHLHRVLTGAGYQEK